MQTLWLLLFTLFCLGICFSDIRVRRVPNWLIILGIAFHGCWLLTPQPWPPHNSHVYSAMPIPALIGLLVGLALFFPLWRFKAMGAGDVKFMAVLGFCIGLAGLFPALIIGSLLAGVHAVAAIAAKGWGGARAVWRLAPDVRRGIPYAAYTAMGALFGAIWLLFQPEPWLLMLAG